MQEKQEERFVWNWIDGGGFGVGGILEQGVLVYFWGEEGL